MWHREINFIVRDAFTVDALTDVNWDHGLLRSTGKELLLKARDFLSLSLHVGDVLEFVSSGRRKIVSIDFSINPYVRVDLDGAPLIAEDTNGARQDRAPTMSAVAATRATADAIVIGGGFYGCETALELRRLGFSKVIVAERENDILRRASFVNQARVHNGYHYPRARATALRSRRNFERFIGDYADEVVHGMEKYYAIARGSRVSADQFAAFCQTIGAASQAASHEIERLFAPGRSSGCFRCVSSFSTPTSLRVGCATNSGPRRSR